MRTFALEPFLVAGLLAAGAAVSAGWTPAPARAFPAAAAEDRSAAAVESAGFTVSDLDKSVAFYSEVLGFRLLEEPTEIVGPELDRLRGVFGSRVRIARLALGEERIELTEYLVPRGKPYPDGSRGNDRWFQHFAIVVSDLDAAYAHLRTHRVEHASTGPQRLPAWNRNAGGIGAFYFRDPDGHFLELIQFPEGKGDPRWKRKAASAVPTDPKSLFLGIDHTAITASNTDASRAFYGNLLGLRLAGESENYGTEQEHLNHVFGARLRISGLRGASGFGVELLEYLTPTDGRSLGDGPAPNDLAFGEITFSVPNLDAAERALLASRARLVSPGIVTVPAGAAGSRRALLARDPDGHGVHLIERSLH